MLQFEALLEHEHLLGERIFACGTAISDRIEKLKGKREDLIPTKWTSPPNVTVDDATRQSMSYYIHLINHFADQVHLQAEEAMIDVAIGCGMPARDGEWVINQHNQARAYWQGLNVAWRRIVNGDDDDRWYALVDFQRNVDAFVYLFAAHAVRENNQFYDLAGKYIKDATDPLVVNIIQHSGPSDISPYVGMVERMEALLGIPSPPPDPAAATAGS